MLLISKEKSHLLYSKKVINRVTEIKNAADISSFLKKLVENSFKKYARKSYPDISASLSTVNLPHIKSFDYCKNDLTNENLAALNSIPNNKTPGNFGFSKYLNKTFSVDLKDVSLPFLNEKERSFEPAYCREKLQ